MLALAVPEVLLGPKHDPPNGEILVFEFSRYFGLQQSAISGQESRARLVLRVPDLRAVALPA